MDDDLVKYVYDVCCVLSEEVPSGIGSDDFSWSPRFVMKADRIDFGS